MALRRRTFHFSETPVGSFQSRRDPGMALRLPSEVPMGRKTVLFQSRRDPGMALRRAAFRVSCRPAAKVSIPS